MSDLNEWIKERRRIHAKGSTGYWASDEKNWDEPYDTTLVYDVFHNGDTMDRDHVADASYDNAEVIVDAHNTLPALLTAVEKVLELHTETVHGECAICFECTYDGAYEADYSPLDYPCPTVRSIEEAINE